MKRKEENPVKDVLIKIGQILFYALFFAFFTVIITISWKCWDPFYNTRKISDRGTMPIMVPIGIAIIVVLLIVWLVLKLLKKEDKIMLIVGGLAVASIVTCATLYLVGPLSKRIKAPEWSYGYVTTDFVGLQPYIVKTGSMVGSKKDNFDPGDIVFCWVVNDESEVKVGDVVSYTVGDPMEHFIVIHRLVGQEEDGSYIFQGDANDARDLNSVSANALQAKYFGKIPKFGWAVAFLAQHRIPIILFVFAIEIVRTVLFDKDEDEDEDEEATIEIPVVNEDEEVEIEDDEEEDVDESDTEEED